MSCDVIDELNYKILIYIKEYISERDYPPTVREIAEALAIKSTNTVQSRLKKMAASKILTYEKYKSRTIRIL